MSFSQLFTSSWLRSLCLNTTKGIWSHSAIGLIYFWKMMLFSGAIALPEKTILGIGSVWLPSNCLTPCNTFPLTNMLSPGSSTMRCCPTWYSKVEFSTEASSKSGCQCKGPSKCGSSASSSWKYVIANVMELWNICSRNWWLSRMGTVPLSPAFFWFNRRSFGSRPGCADVCTIIRL